MRRYTQKEKDDALQLALEIGARQAANQLSISYTTLLNWRKEKSTTTDAADIPESSPQSDVNDSVDASEPLAESIVHPLELQVRLLQQEVAHLKAKCARQAEAIHALSPIES